MTRSNAIPDPVPNKKYTPLPIKSKRVADTWYTNNGHLTIWHKNRTMTLHRLQQRRKTSKISSRGATCDAQGRKKRKRAQLKHRYNKTTEEWELLFKQQNYKCKLCGKFVSPTSDYHTDHKPGTGFFHATAYRQLHTGIPAVVRGILCRSCNVRMSAVDDADWLTKAIVYRDSDGKRTS